MPDTHEDIRRRLFDAAWETPAYAPVPERTVARARRRAALTIGGGTVVLVAVAVAIFALAGTPRPIERDRTGGEVHGDDPGEFLVDTSTGDRSAFDALPPGAWLYDTSPDGSRVAFVTKTDGRDQVWIMDMDGTDRHQLTHDPFEATDPAWAPDGTQIVYVGFGQGDSRDLFVIDLAGGRPHKVMTEPEDPNNPGWSSDGSRIVYWCWIETDDPAEVSTTPTSVEVRSVNVRSGRVSVLAGGKNRSGAWEAAPAERSGRIAYIGAHFRLGSGGADHALWLMEGDGSRKEQLLRVDADDALGPAWSPDGNRLAYIAARHSSYSVHVFDLATREDREVAKGVYAAWVDDTTLLVQEYLPGHPSP